MNRALAHFPNLLRWVARSVLKALHPKRRRWRTSAFLLKSFSLGVIPLFDEVVLRACKKFAVEIASTHTFDGRVQSSSIAWAFALCVWIILSETPFLCCVYGGEGSKVIPYSVRIDRNASLSYSPLPLWHQNQVIQWCSCNSTKVLKSLNTVQTSADDFERKKHTQV